MLAKIKKLPIVDYLFLTIGAIAMAIGLSAFLINAKVVPGGVSGLSLAIYYLSGDKIPVGLSMWALNAPLFLWGLKELGGNFAFRTFYSFTMYSIFVDLFRGDISFFYYIRLQDLPAVREIYQNDFLFLILLGAVFIGGGLGLIFKFKGTTAGTDIVAAVLNKYFGVKPGQMMILTDFIIISFAGIVIGTKGLSPDKPAFVLTLYSFFLSIISAKIIDSIVYGVGYAKLVYIISDKHVEIEQAIMKKLKRGATELKSRGIYRKTDTDVVITTVALKELAHLEALCKNIDKDAFIVVCNVREVLGRGFRKIS